MRAQQLVLLAMALSMALSMAAIVSAERRIDWQDVANWPFARYETEFHKSYSSAQHRSAAAAIYEARRADIIAHNADNTKTWKRTITRFADVENGKSFFGYRPMGKSLNNPYAKPYVEPAIPAGSPFPAAVDWRKQGIISGVKDQGQCGSCYAHAATEQLESYMAMASGSLPVLSQMQGASCTFNPEDCGGNGGCGGGTAETVLDSVAKRGGMASIWTYPYQSYWGKNYECKFNNTHAFGGTPAVVTTDGHVTLPTNNYTATMQHLAFVGPLAISVDAGAWVDYHSGVYNGCGTDSVTIDHAVQLVGYGTDPKFGPYWTVRNSWGIVFGEEGFIRVARNSPENTPCGMDMHPKDGSGCNGGPTEVEVCGSCGILFDTVYPVNVRAA